MPSNQYSPTAEQPYQPTVAPEIVQPTPSPVAPQNPAPTGIQAAGNISHVGAVAGIADNILRGFMQGRAQRDARLAMTTKRQTDIMEASYNSAASQLLQMHRDGVDPNSTEYKQAKDAVDGSFAAKNAYYAQHVLAGDQKPKKGKKGEQEPTTIGEMVQSKDPAVQAKGWLLLQQKAGPPVYHQIASSSTPQAQQARKTEEVQGQAQSVAAQNNLKQQQLIARRTDILAKPTEQRSKSENDELENINETLAPQPKPRADQPGDQAKKAADAVFTRMEDPAYKPTDRDKFILRVGGYDVTPDTKIQVTPRGEIISSDRDGNYKVLRGPQREYETKAELGGDGPGKPKRGTPTQFSQVEKDTHEAYQKARDKYQNAINGIDDAVAKEAAAHGKKSSTPVSWTPDRIAAEKKKAADALEDENKSIASLNSARTRDLGGIPGDDQQHPAVAAHQPESTHGQDTSEYMAVPNPKGLVEPGNIPIWNRPTVQNPDGSHSSEYSTSFRDDKGREVLVPTVVDGKFLTPNGKKPKEGSAEEKAMFKKAWQHYLDTGQNLGKFSNADDADAYAGKLHSRGSRPGGQDTPPPGATSEVFDPKTGALTGWVVDGEYRAKK